MVRSVFQGVEFMFAAKAGLWIQACYGILGLLLNLVKDLLDVFLVAIGFSASVSSR